MPAARRKCSAQLPPSTASGGDCEPRTSPVHVVTDAAPPMVEAIVRALQLAERPRGPPFSSHEAQRITDFVRHAVGGGRGAFDIAVALQSATEDVQKLLPCFVDATTALQATNQLERLLEHTTRTFLHAAAASGALRSLFERRVLASADSWASMKDRHSFSQDVAMVFDEAVTTPTVARLQIALSTLLTAAPTASRYRLPVVSGESGSGKTVASILAAAPPRTDSHVVVYMTPRDVTARDDVFAKVVTDDNRREQMLCDSFIRSLRRLLTPMDMPDAALPCQASDTVVTIVVEVGKEGRKLWFWPRWA